MVAGCFFFCYANYPGILVHWDHWFMNKIFVSMRKANKTTAEKKMQRSLPHIIIAWFSLHKIASNLSSAQLHRHQPPQKNWSKYEDQYFLIFMNRAGSRIVFNNNSPTCNAFRMTERSIFVAISLAFGMVRHCWLFKNGDTSAPVYTSRSTPMQTWIWYVVCTTYLNEWMNIES